MTTSPGDGDGDGEGDGDLAQPRLPRRGVLLLIALGGAALVAALAAPLLGEPSASSRTTWTSPSSSSPGPYGVAGCEPRPGATAVDVAVTARALSADGSPAATLGGAASGPQVGASVRDLAGYAAQAVAPCGVVQVTVHLQDAAAGGTVAASLQRQPRPQEADDDGRGRLVAVDWRTWEASLPEGARAGELTEQASWLVTLVDPAPGTYRLTGRVSEAGDASSSGDVEVLLAVTPHGA